MQSANGVTGHLLYTGDTYVFRVYDARHNFIDYDIFHCDLCITINDADAYFYYKPTPCIDHSSETLGIETTE